MNDNEKRKALITKGMKDLYESLMDSVQQFNKYDQPSINDDFDVIHNRLLFTSSIEQDLSYINRQSLAIKHEVETSYYRATHELQDAETEATQRPGFKPMGTFMSRAETDAKLRSMTFEEVFELREWEGLLQDAKYLADTIKSYKDDAYRQRKDIELRLKIISMSF